MMYEKSIRRSTGLLWLQNALNLVKSVEPLMLFGLLMVMWAFGPYWLRTADNTVGSVDQSIWLLVVLSIISFLVLCFLSWWLLQRFWFIMNLPEISFMVSQFKSLELWQQLGFLWASFALLLLAAAICLSAVC